MAIWPEIQLKKDSMRILFYGDRDWTDANVISAVLQHCTELYGDKITIVHGAARGADSIAGQLAEALGLTVEAHPANWAQYGRAAGVIRNKEMLDSGLDLGMGFHDNIAESKGTKHMKSLLDRAQINNYLFTTYHLSIPTLYDATK